MGKIKEKLLQPFPPSFNPIIKLIYNFISWEDE